VRAVRVARTSVQRRPRARAHTLRATLPPRSLAHARDDTPHPGLRSPLARLPGATLELLWGYSLPAAPRLSTTRAATVFFARVQRPLCSKARDDTCALQERDVGRPRFLPRGEKAPLCDITADAFPIRTAELPRSLRAYENVIRSTSGSDHFQRNEGLPAATLRSGVPRRDPLISKVRRTT
jgi:hypothetical protein